MKKIEDAIPEYVMKNAKTIGGRGASNSVLGTLESYTTAYRYQYAEAKQAIDDYFRHALKKQKGMRVQKEHTDFTQVKKAVDSVLNMDREQLETGLGISTADKYMEIPRMKY